MAHVAMVVSPFEFLGIADASFELVIFLFFVQSRVIIFGFIKGILHLGFDPVFLLACLG